MWLAVLGLTFALLAPLWLRQGLPPIPEVQQQIVRTLEISHSLQAGVIYPRWASDFNYGYGSPLWNYLAPLPHWLAGLYHALTQADPAVAVKAVITLGTLLGVLGSFSFARRRWGAYAGVLAALGFASSPSVIWDTPLTTANIGLLLSTGIFLSGLWSYECLLSDGRRRDLLIATLLTAALWLSHTPMNLLLNTTLAGWVVWSTWQQTVSRRSMWQAVVAWTLGLLLGSFYLVPALLERNLVHWYAISAWPLADWHPISIKTLLALPPRLDLSAANLPATNAVGAAIWSLALISVGSALYRAWRATPSPADKMSRGEVWQVRLVALPRHMAPAHRDMFYFVLTGMLAGAACTSLAMPLWERIPPWLTWYPRDLILPVTATGALVIAPLGVMLQQMRSKQAGLVGLTGCAVLLVAAALPLLTLPSWPENRTPTSIQDILRDEGRGYLVSSFLDGSLLPSHLATLPAPSPSLLTSYQTGYVDRVIRDRLPTGTQADVIESGPRGQRLIVNSRHAFSLVLYTLYFPGWGATVDGRKTAVRADPHTGFLSIDVPVGRHEVRVAFGSTSPRGLGWGVSGLAAILLLSVAFWQELFPRPSASSRRGEANPGQWEVDRSSVFMSSGLVALVALALAIPRFVPTGWARQSPPGIVQTATALPRAFQGGIDLLAFSLEDSQSLHPGDLLAIHLYWRAVQPDLPDYQAELQLISADEENAESWLVVQHRHLAGIPTSRWAWWPLLKTYLRDSYYLRLPSDMPPGHYRITVQLGACHLTTLAPCSTIAPLFVYDGRGSRLGNQIVLPVDLRISLRS